MFSSVSYLLLCALLLLYATKSCKAEVIPPSLVLYSPGSPEHAEVVVRRVHDELVLRCELRGDAVPRGHVWNYVPGNTTLGNDVRGYTTSPGPAQPSLASELRKTDLRAADSGHYMCSAPPFSVTKYVVVQTHVSKQCALSAFGCGARCVLADHVCDGRRDCLHGEDEDHHLCPPRVCQRADRLNCSSGRCIPEAACCRSDSGLCVQPACCNEYPRYSRLEGYVDVEYPPLYEDRHAPDDYGFIQSTIYTVTACALIFMIAVVLLVSALCKMHMKRAALRSYAHAEAATRHHYSLHYAQASRFPPCYEASRLLEVPGTPAGVQPACGAESPDSPEAPAGAEPRGFGLARLSTLLTSRYRQVPLQCPDVEMTSVGPRSPGRSPLGSPLGSPLRNCRSPSYCADALPPLPPAPGSPSSPSSPAPPPSPPTSLLLRRAVRRNTLERVMDHIHTQRHTLQLGRFQVSLPSFGRRPPPRPDTPTVHDIDIHDLDFLRITGDDTYTLNGRTIRLLGASFDAYPDGSRPPPYTEAVRYKLYGPPPEYLSREGLDQPREGREHEARTNIEMPPCYDDLASTTDNADNNNSVRSVMDGNSNTCNGISVAENGISSAIAAVDNGVSLTSNAIGNNGVNITDNVNCNVVIVDNVTNVADNNNAESLNSVIDNLPAIDSDVNANDAIDNGN